VAFNAVVRGGGEIFAKLASLVFFLAVARQLGEGIFGDLMFALSFTTVMTLPSGFGTEELIARDVARDPESVHSYASNVMLIKVVLSVVLLALAIGIVVVAGYPAEVQLAVVIVGASVAIENLGRTWHAVFQAYQRMEFVSLALIVQRVLTAAAGVAVLIAGGGLLEVSFVMLGSSIVGFTVATASMQRWVVALRPSIDRKQWMGLFRAGLPIGMVAVLVTALVKIDQTLISFLSENGNREVGFYAAAFRLIEATMFIGWAVSAAMLPWFASDGERDRMAGGFELATKATAAVLVPVGLVFVLFAEPLIDLLYGDAYGPAVAPLRYLGAMVVFLGINNLAAILLVARDRPAAFARAAAVVLVANIALNVITIPVYGATGAAAVAALSAFLLFALGFRLVRSLTGRLNLGRALAGPIAGGALMSATVLAASLPPIAEVVAGSLAYVVGLAAFERLVFPADFKVARGFTLRRTARAA